MTKSTADQTATEHKDALERVMNLQDLLKDRSLWRTAEYQIRVTVCTYETETRKVLDTSDKGWNFAVLLPFRNATLWVTEHGVVQVDADSRVFRALDEYGLDLLETDELNAIADLVLERFEQLNRTHLAGTSLA